MLSDTSRAFNEPHQHSLGVLFNKMLSLPDNPCVKYFINHFFDIIFIMCRYFELVSVEDGHTTDYIPKLIQFDFNSKSCKLCNI